MESNLKTAFRFHFARQLQAHRGVKPGIMAKHCLALAREDMAAGKARYFDSYIHRAHKDANGMIYLGDKPENFGLRLVGRVQVEPSYRNGYWDSSERSGYYADSHYSELCFPLVYQLPARDGKSRFVAAYDFSDRDGGLVFDLRTIFEECRRDGSHWDSVHDLDAAREAARHADSLASAAAEEEREYSTAWQAGAQWADEQEAIKAARQEALAILRERRAVKGQPGFPALCKAIRAQVQSLISDIEQARAKAAKLASGDAEELYFWQGDKRLQGAFCEGAGLQSFPL